MNKEWLYGKTITELKEVVNVVGAKPFVAKQIADWIYKKEVKEIDLMMNISQAIREKLKENYQVGGTVFENVVESVDGTKKYLYKTINGSYIETAYIPDGDRATLCVSSQAGCRMGCVFCMTARQGFQENLSSGQILNQIRENEDRDKISNVVYMGMGEPLDNTDEVLKSIEILTSEWGYAWSPYRVTLSTIGVLGGLKRFLEETRANLTISLHSPFPEIRKKLMPSERKNEIEKIVSEIKKYDFSHQRRVSFGYTVFEGVNDREEDVDQIVRILKGIYCRINLIPFHKIPGTDLRPVSNNKMVRFRDAINARGFIATIRTSRGQDIDAACGLLSTKKMNNQI